MTHENWNRDLVAEFRAKRRRQLDLVIIAAEFIAVLGVFKQFPGMVSNTVVGVVAILAVCYVFLE